MGTLPENWLMALAASGIASAAAPEAARDERACWVQDAGRFEVNKAVHRHMPGRSYEAWVLDLIADQFLAHMWMRARAAFLLRHAPSFLRTETWEMPRQAMLPTRWVFLQSVLERPDETQAFREWQAWEACQTLLEHGRRPVAPRLWLPETAARLDGVEPTAIALG